MTPLKLLALSSALALLAACRGEVTAAPAAIAAAPTLPAGMFVATPPAGALDVRDVRENAENGQDVVLRGVVGGRAKPFVKDRAVMGIIDARLTSCAPEDGCPTPWDYCCLTDETLLANVATVQVVDADGSPLGLGLDGAHGIQALAEVIVEGTIQHTADGLIIDARKIHVVGS